MPYSITDRTIAVAGIYQAVYLVHCIATTGSISDSDFETSINSIFLVDVEKPVDVFGNSQAINTGLSVLIKQLGDNFSDEINVKDLHITKYAIGIMVLEKQLRKNTRMLNEISIGIERAFNQSIHYSITHENVIASLADIYKSTISTLQPRIMVQGEQVYISNPNNANKIRALLLAAIRSVVLWRQCGGNRWQLIYQRKKIIDTAKALLKEV